MPLKQGQSSRLSSCSSNFNSRKIYLLGHYRLLLKGEDIHREDQMRGFGAMAGTIFRAFNLSTWEPDSIFRGN